MRRLAVAVVLLALSAELVAAQTDERLTRARQLNAEVFQHYGEGRYAEAIPLAREALALREAVLGPEHPDVGQSVNNLAQLLLATGDYAGARPLAERVLRMNEVALGAAHPTVAISLDNLAALLSAMGDHGAARPLSERAVRVTEAAFGPTHPTLGIRLSNLAEILRALGDYAAARPVAERALAITEGALGPTHADVGTRVNNLAAVLEATGDYAGAKPLYERALAISEVVLGPNHPTTGNRLNNLAALLHEMGEYVDARGLSERALSVTEVALGSNHPLVGNRINNLASLLRETGDNEGARILFERALQITEHALGPHHPDVAVRLNNLAGLVQATGNARRARALYERALSVTEAALGPHHPDVGLRLNNLALVLRALGDDAAAAPLLERALRINEQALGPTHPAVATTLGNLGSLRHALGDHAAARPLHERALRITESVYGSRHPHVALSLTNLAALLAATGDYAGARRHYEAARSIDAEVVAAGRRLGDEALRGRERATSAVLADHVALLAGIARNPSRDPQLTAPAAEAFLVAEHARGRGAQSALARAGARVAAGNAGTAGLARRVQDLDARRDAVRKQVVEEYGQPPARRDAARLAALRQTITTLDADYETAMRALRTSFPRYDELATASPIDVTAAQRLLRADEALLSVFTLADRVLVWLLRPGRPLVYRDVEVRYGVLLALVRRVRVSLDQSANADQISGRLAPFDVAGAHELYRRVVAPVAAELAGVRHLIVVPDEVLLPLPFGALVTSAQGEAYRALAELAVRGAAPVATELVAYSKVSWLAAEYAITVLPSASSLRALRGRQRTHTAQVEPLIGFGDPVLQGSGTQRGGPMVVSRGTNVLAELRALDALPGTRDELRAMSQALGADPAQAVYVGARATKPQVFALDATGRLGRARVLAFATHGLLAGEIAGLRQPALVLTPPPQLAGDDDGLLSLDDVVTLRLTNTEWVILSACNTGAGDGSGEGLSGLARGFFFAGAPALLVSHWSVEDRATQALMTEVFQRWRPGGPVSRAEALRQGMRALMQRAQGPTAYFAHPFAWAAFFLVGEGR